MQLKEALKSGWANKQLQGVPLQLFLACGFTTLHLPTFLIAHLTNAGLTQRVQTTVGSYGDLCSALNDARDTTSDIVVLIIEYADLDPRLGLRRSGGWSKQSIRDAAVGAGHKLAHLYERLELLSHPVIIIGPTLPLPPLFNAGSWQASPDEMRIKSAVANFMAQAANLPNVTICKSERLDGLSPVAQRRDVRSELAVDFPYSLDHTDAVTASIAAVMQPPKALKAVITDLDDTFWRGLVGEVGATDVTWSLDGNSQMHAVYQQTLQSLAENGILIGIASKNDAEVVQAALDRGDVLVQRDRIFPVEAGWGQKSESIRKILSAWNIGADAVVFIDDNLLELEEARVNFPSINTLHFPTNNDAAAFNMLASLRDMFHKVSPSEEAELRVSSLRAAKEAATYAENAVSQDEFLKTLNSAINFQYGTGKDDGRAIELINKTNQFNINGRRITESEWTAYKAQSNSMICVVQYTDKFGPLGRISVVYGKLVGTSLQIDGWVLSCRAFSRRIEHAVLKELFNRYNVDEINLAWLPTERNSAAQRFISQVVSNTENDWQAVRKSDFMGTCVETYHTVTNSGESYDHT